MVKLVCNNINYSLKPQMPSLSSKMRKLVIKGPTLLCLGSPHPHDGPAFHCQLHTYSGPSGPNPLPYEQDS